MQRTARQQGFAIVEVLLVVVLVSIIAFVAWRVIEATGDVQNAQNQVPQSTVVNSPSAPATVPAANTTSDLTTLQTQLNGTQVEDNTSSELDTQTTF